MPLGSALGLLIYSWPDVMWSEDAARAQVLGFDAMADQRLAETIMWVGGDLLLLGALTLVGLDWFITERRRRRRTGAHYQHA